MNINDILKKLKYKDGYRALLLNAPSEYGEAARDFGFDLQAGTSKYDFAHLFVNNRAEVDKYGKQVVDCLKFDGFLWISYPKGGANTDINRDQGWETITSMGLRPVSQISIDSKWSALRFRPVERVKKR
ncbi:MAG: hypothetical protein OIN66_05935 [Candidatus Methanoperedens sp.]|nr:hypothetical protein [Candidatus Methanoperedens sp.]